MKTGIIRSFIMVVAIFTASLSASAQIYVKVRPTYKTVERPVQPGPDYVWVDEDWQVRGRNYRYNGGHWVKAPRHGYTYTPGHWKQTRRGDMWVRGSWRRGN